MLWRDILHQLIDHLADAHLLEHQADFGRWALGKILANPSAGDGTTEVNVTDLANEYRKAKGIMTHEEHCEQLAEERVLAMHRKAKGK